MKGLREKIEYWLTAVTLAEAGEHEGACQLVGQKMVQTKWLSLNDIMTAIPFAKAGLPESAREFLGTKRPVQQPLGLELPGVKICFGTATING